MLWEVTITTPSKCQMSTKQVQSTLPPHLGRGSTFTPVLGRDRLPLADSSRLSQSRHNYYFSSMCTRTRQEIHIIKWNNSAKSVWVTNRTPLSARSPLSRLVLDFRTLQALESVKCQYHSVATQSKGRDSNSRLKLPLIKTSLLGSVHSHHQKSLTYDFITSSLAVCISVCHSTYVEVRGEPQRWFSPSPCGSWDPMLVLRCVGR